VRRSPAGSSAEVAVRGAARLTVRCARRTAPLVLLAPGLRSAARVDEEGGAVQVPVFPATAEGAGERARPRVLVERDGPWAVVRAAADPEEQVELSLWAYPPEPFGASLEHAVEPAGADVRAYPGLDAVLVRAFGSTLARVRLRAGQRLAVAASIGGAAVAPAEMLSDEGGPTGVLALYLPPSDAAALPLALPAAADVRARRVYAGPPMEALYDLDDDDVRFLRRLGPLE